MKNKINKLIEKYELEVFDTYDEYSHGDATARIQAYINVIKDLEELLLEEY